LQSGKQMWMAKTGPAWQAHASNPSWNGARCTPSVDGDRIYAINPDGTLYCVTKNGQPVWQKSLVNELGGVKHDGWGYSESPLVDGQWLIVTPGGEKATVVALDKITGETRWTCSRPGDVGAGHSSIVVSRINGRKVYVQNTAGGPLGIDAESGRLLWDYDIPAPTAFIPTPIIKNDLVFTVAGYGTGGALLRQIPSNDGVDVQEIYGLNKELDNKHGGVILVGDHLFAGKSDSNQVYCADLQSGDIRWRERGSGKGSIAVIAGDGKLFVRFKDGTMALALATPEGYREVSSFTTPGSGDAEMPSWAHPVISDGKLLLRENDSILCYDIRN
jgi:outer membrane protein assembly factor BamB